MNQLYSILLAAVTGFISGLVLSIPVGPINLTILNEGARRGFKWAVLIGLGATSMEVIYCFIAFTGFASFFKEGSIKSAMELFSFVFMLFIGTKFILAKSAKSPVDLGVRAGRFEERLQHRLQPHSAFMIGLVRVMGNLGVLAFWIVLATYFLSREWVAPDWRSKMACVGGVGLGTGLWFTALSKMVSRGYGRFDEKTLIRIEHGSGVILILLALIHGGLIIKELIKHQL
jgi:L-lysine exporter family protein LysE/ArgO